MPCYSPIFALIQKDKNGFKKIKILDRKYAYDLRNNSIKSLDLNGKVTVHGVTDEAFCRNVVSLPCGKCIGCRLDYSRQWADRCMLELQDHDESYFCTFTYDDEHVPRSFYTDNNGEVHDCMTLQKRDMQLFFKRLRKAGQKVRYFMCGEYGDNTMRPHYHAIIFGLHLDDLQLYKQSERGDNYYISKFLSDLWSIETKTESGEIVKEPLGYVVVGQVTWDTCAYTARYVIKKLNGSQKDLYEQFNLVPEYVTMSRRPGIASNYYDQHKDDLWKYSEFYISTDEGGRRLHPPKYFERKLEKDNPVLLEKIKQDRLDSMTSSRQFEFAGTDEFIELLPHLRQSQHESKIKILKARNKV